MEISLSTPTQIYYYGNVPVNPNTDMEISLSTPTQLIGKCPRHPQHRHGNMPGNPNTCMKRSLATPVLFCSNIIAQKILRQESAQKVDPGEENSPTAPAGTRTYELLITNLALLALIYLLEIRSSSLSVSIM